MNPEITPVLSKDQNEELLPWHTPEIQRLAVSLDTAFSPGSGNDGGFSSTTTTPPTTP